MLHVLFEHCSSVGKMKRINEFHWRPRTNKNKKTLNNTLTLRTVSFNALIIEICKICLHKLWKYIFLWDLHWVKKTFNLKRSIGFFFENVKQYDVESNIYFYLGYIYSHRAFAYAVYAQLLNGMNHCCYVNRSPI